MNNTHKKIYIIVAVVVVVISGLALYYQKWGKGLPPESIKVEGQPSVGETPVIVNDTDVMRRAIDTQDTSLCVSIAREDERKICEINVIIAEAGLKQDAGICEQIQQSDFKAACKDNTIITKALNAKNPTLCEQMADQTRIEQCKKDVEQLK